MPPASAPARPALARLRVAPVVSTATSPTTARSSVPDFTPLADATEGEWAVYSALDDRELRYEILRAADSGVTTRISVYQGGKPLGLPALREQPRDFDTLARQAEADRADRRMTPARIEAAGRTWDTLLYEDRWTEEEVAYVRRTWVSVQAPVYGILRMELHGDGQLESRLELKAFRQKQAGSTPAK